MNRTDRLQAILTQLQTKKIVTAHEIATEFEISLRTVYRDIRALEEAGIPIGAEAGIGYFLDESFHLPPVMFTTQEATALLTAGKLMPFLVDQKVNKAYRGAMAKVRAVLKSKDKDYVESLDTSMKVLHEEKAVPGRENIFIQEIQKALVDRNVVKMEYCTRYNQITDQRMVEPVSLVYYGYNWHLLAWCRLRQEFRDFRLDRIQQIEVLEEKYVRNVEKDFQNYLQKSQESLTLFKINLKVSHTVAMKISDSKYWYGLSDETVENTGYHMVFINSDLEGFANWLLTLGPGVDIIEPQDLLNIVKERVMKLCEKYS